MTMQPLAINDGAGDFHPVPGGGAPTDTPTIDPNDVFNSLDLPVVVLRPDLTIASFNGAGADMLGLAPSDIGRRLRDISVEAGSSNLEKWCAESMSAATASRHDFRRGDQWFVLRIAPCQTGAPRFNGIVLTFTNVTAFRASIGQALYEREYTKGILNTVCDPLIVLDANQRVQTANRAFHEMFRVSREETQNAPLAAVVNRAFDLPRLHLQLQEALVNDREFQPFEIDHDVQGVGRRTLSVNARPLFLPNRPERLMLLVLQDITARKSGEAANAKLAAIVATSDDAIMSMDVAGTITSWNRGAENMFGYTAEEALGQPMTILIPADRRDEVSSGLERVGRGERISHYETVRLRKDGCSVEVSLALSPINDDSGTIVGISKIARDITERKRAEEHRDLLLRELDHRVKNTLAGVQSMAKQTMSSATAPEVFYEAFDARLMALARAHSVLAREGWQGAALRTLVLIALEPYKSDTRQRWTLQGEDISLPSQSALALARGLHELATNAAKYGALSVPTGHVDVTWRMESEFGLHLVWAETGGPPVKMPQRRGFGSRLIEHGLAYELNCKVELEFDPAGLRCAIDVPRNFA
jgi:two-component system CheB/CheR fusion protein